jgi:hypothetical protein
LSGTEWQNRREPNFCPEPGRNPIFAAYRAKTQFFSRLIPIHPRSSRIIPDVLNDVSRNTERFIGRMIRLAYLAPEVLEALVVKRRPPAISINQMVEVATLPWGEQMGRVFG